MDEREQFPYNVRSRLIDQDRPRLAAEMQRLQQRGFEFETALLHGMPEDGIAGFAWHSRARLIVAGCTPTGIIEHWALGCIAEEITDTSLVPVLAVRSAAPLEAWFAINRPLNVFVGFDPVARPDAVLNRLDELCQMGPCKITSTIVAYPETRAKRATTERATAGCHEVKPDQTYRETLCRELAARNISVHHASPGRDVAEDLVDRAGEARADLLVIESHPRDDLTILPHLALAHGILRRAPMSVLCVPEPDIEPPHSVARVQRDETTHQFAPARGSDGDMTNRGESRL